VKPSNLNTPLYTNDTPYFETKPQNLENNSMSSKKLITRFMLTNYGATRSTPKATSCS